MIHLAIALMSALLLAVSADMAAATEAGTRPLMRPNLGVDENGAQMAKPELLAPQAAIRPLQRDGDTVPAARWDHRPSGRIWTRAAISALKSHGRPILQTVPRDIANWCPAYPEADQNGRAAFWAGLMSTLAKHESTYRPEAVGGNGRWYGLLQILPATARGYNCKNPSQDGLKHGPSNLSCAVRILAVTVPRDQVVSEGFRGVAADWGPFHSQRKRADMRAWVRKQDYCRTLGSVRPRARP